MLMNKFYILLRRFSTYQINIDCKLWGVNNDFWMHRGDKVSEGIKPWTN